MKRDKRTFGESLAPAATKYRLSKQQILLGMHLHELGCTYIEYETRVIPERKFRLDLSFVDVVKGYIGIEIDGGMWTGGHRHTSAIERDYEKQNLGQIAGWKILRFTNRQVDNGEAKEFIRKHILGERD